MATLACQGASSGDRVLIELDSAADDPRPDVALVSWLSDEGFLLDSVRVPELGILPAAGSPLATVEIELEPGAAGVRRVLARGLAQGQVVSEAAARVPVLAGQKMRHRLVLQRGRLADGDGDGVPDEVDNCPALANPEQRRCTPDPAPPDPPRAGSDAAAAAEVRPPTTDAGAAPAPDATVMEAGPPVPAPDAQVYNGVLTGSMAEAPAEVDLTAVGKVDWVHFGVAGPDKLDRRAKATLYIDPYRTVGAVMPRSYLDGPVAYKWTDGMPTLAGTNVAGGVAVDGKRNGFQINVRASRNTTRKLRIYLGASDAHGQLSAMLSDGSGPPYDETVKVGGAEVRVFVFTLTFKAAADNKSLIVVWRSQLDGGFVTLESVALE